MVYMRRLLGPWLLGTLLIASSPGSGADSQVLATVGEYAVTADALEEALASSPFATQFPAMDEDDQAALRGDLLRRLVATRLLYLEALRLGLEQSAGFAGDAERYRQGLLYRAYMDRLRAGIELPAEEQEQIRQEFPDDADARAAAKSQYVLERYEVLRPLALASLRDRFHFLVHEDRLPAGPFPGLAPETVLAEGDGLTIRYADILEGVEGEPLTAPEEIRQALYDEAELLLVARAAEADGIDVGAGLTAYREDRLPELLLQAKVQEWVPDEQVLRDYFAAHPEIGYLPENRHIGQLVVATRAEAQALRQRILAGESLFELAGQYSIDPYGKAHLGDMGWLKAGTGLPEVEAALKDLADGQASEVIESPLGFHLVLIQARRPSDQKGFEEVRDRVGQLLISERLPLYVEELRERFPVHWALPVAPQGQASSQ